MRSSVKPDETISKNWSNTKHCSAHLLDVFVLVVLDTMECGEKRTTGRPHEKLEDAKFSGARRRCAAVNITAKQTFT